MKLYRYEPWNLLSQWQKDLDRMMNANQAEPSVAGDEETNVATSAWMPPVDIKESDQAFVIHADIPGVDPKDIEITMENGVLTIKGERVLETKEERKDYKRVERLRGAFHRRFSLPDTADAEKISATGKHGVLEIVIPKRALAQSRKIKVES
jgi:HSP20 family protein